MRSGNIIKAAAFGAGDSGLATSAKSVRVATKIQAPQAQPEHEHEPEIKLHREGDEIIAIEVLCGCGRTTFIECQYGTETK